MLLELKSHFDGDMRLVERAIDVLAGYGGPVAVMSFDPDLIEVSCAIRCAGPYDAESSPNGTIRIREWDKLPRSQKRNLSWLLHAPRTRPQFIAYSVRDLASGGAVGGAQRMGLPLLTWTVRSVDDRKTASRWADQIIFEGWRP